MQIFTALARTFLQNIERQMFSQTLEDNKNMLFMILHASDL